MEDLEIDIDIKTLAYGPIAKYHNIDLFEKDVKWYEEHGYKIYAFDASKWYTVEDFYSDTHETFGFPGYFGRNWGAFDDSIIDIDGGETGNVLVSVHNFETWHKEDRVNAHIFLDIMASRTYSYLVGGKRFVTLIQSNDLKLNVDDVGSKRVHWNWTERDNKSRGTKS